MGDVLQLHLHLFQLPQQGADVLQVAILELQLLVGPGHTEGGQQHHAGDHRQGGAELYGVVGTLELQFGADRHHQLQGQHPGEMHGADRGAHGQAGGNLQQLVAFVVVTEKAG
ncbi:hypothetical protein D9M71_581090 [compost metagenome]